MSAPQAEISDQSHKRLTQGKTVLVVVGVVLLLVLAAAAIFVATSLKAKADAEAESQAVANFRATQFQTEARDCGIGANSFEYLDSGEAIRFNRVTKYDGTSVDELFCFLGAIDAPQSLEGKISQTRALDGTRSDTWNEFEATWTYHPDAGLNMLVERVGEPVMPHESD